LLSWWSLEHSLPQTSELFTLRNQTLTIKAADGTILQQQGPATREQLKLEEMPKPLIQAFCLRRQALLPTPRR